MISNDKLKNVADTTVTRENENVIVKASFLKKMAKELLTYRSNNVIRRSDEVTESGYYWTRGNGDDKWIISKVSDREHSAITEEYFGTELYRFLNWEYIGPLKEPEN